MSSTLRRATACLMTLALVACGDDSPTGTNDDLSPQELADLAEIMSVLSLDAGFAGLGGGGSAVPITFPLESQTIPCPEGGNYFIEGEVTIDSETFDLELDATATHQNCRAEASSGTVWTVNGNPDISYMLDLTFNSSLTQFTMGVNQNGNFTWNNGSRSGDCSMNLTISMTGNLSTDGTLQSYSGTFSGSLCGSSVSENFSFP